MKSTLKVDYASNGTPVIKIIRPNEVVNLNENEDYDVRDRLLNDFLQSPMNADRNGLFEVYTHGNLDESGSRGVITTIAPLDIKHQFYTFRHNILNKLVPYNTLVAINRDEINVNTPNIYPNCSDIIKYNRVIEFFNWVDNTEWAEWHEQQPCAETVDINPDKYIAERYKYPATRTRRDYFELELHDELRMKAFDATPKELWDETVGSLHEAMDRVIGWRMEDLPPHKGHIIKIDDSPEI